MCEPLIDHYSSNISFLNSFLAFHLSLSSMKNPATGHEVGELHRESSSGHEAG